MPPPRLGLAALGVALAVAGCGSSPRPVVAAFPSPGARAIAPQTSISLRGAAPGSLGEVLAVGSRSGAHVGRLVPHSDGRGASFVPTRWFAPGELVTVSLGGARVAGVRDGRLRFRVAGTAHPVYEKLPHHRGGPPARRRGAPGGPRGRRSAGRRARRRGGGSRARRRRARRRAPGRGRWAGRAVLSGLRRAPRRGRRGRGAAVRLFFLMIRRPP